MKYRCCCPGERHKTPLKCLMRRYGKKVLFLGPLLPILIWDEVQWAQFFHTFDEYEK